MTGEGITNLSRGIFLFVSLLLLTVSCKLDSRYSFNEALPPEGWNKYNRPSFTVELSDTLSAYDLRFSIRNSHNYPYRNIFLFVGTSSPTGQYLKDTIEFQLADEKGNWYGKGLGDIHNLTVPYKTNVLFTTAGEYTFQIQHGMRTENLEGIIDVGLIIKKRDN
jgi:gliding motility-associated lipoprotein GldH